LKKLADLTAQYAWVAKIPYFVVPRITKLAAAKKTDEACQVAKDVLDRAVSHEDTSMLNGLAFSLRAPALRENKEMGTIAIKAAEANLKLLGENDYGAEFSAAETHFAVGDKSKARGHAAKAIGAIDKPYQIPGLLRSEVVKGDKELLGQVLKSAEAALAKAGDSDTGALMNVADTHFALGDKAKAKEYGEKAVEAAKTPALKKSLETRVKKFDDEK